MGDQAQATWLDIARFDWVQVNRASTLHAVGSLENPGMVEDDWGGRGNTTCGLIGDLRIPGLFSRMGLKRCSRCCRLTGLPGGVGSPKNDDACRPLVGLEES